MKPRSATPAPTALRPLAARAARPDPHVRAWIARQLAAAPPHAPSLIITLWGDAIAPHGGAVLLPALIRLLAPFRINERLVRTSVFRLVRQGWLMTARVGRRSVYSLTPDGSRRFDDAHRRIYTFPEETWDGTWACVVTDGLSAGERRGLATELRWAGFGDFGLGLLARPSLPADNVAAIIHRLGIANRVLAARAVDDATLGGRTLASVVPRAWDLAGVAVRYHRVLRRFGTVIERFRAHDEADLHPEQCFVAHTLLVHDYRRALLRDPRLPAALLPLDWPASAAYALCGDFHRLTHRRGEQHLQAVVEAAGGTLPPVAEDLAPRFGGLAASETGRTRRRP